MIHVIELAIQFFIAVRAGFGGASFAETENCIVVDHRIYSPFGRIQSRRESGGTSDIKGAGDRAAGTNYTHGGGIIEVGGGVGRRAALTIAGPGGMGNGAVQVGPIKDNGAGGGTVATGRA